MVARALLPKAVVLRAVALSAAGCATPLMADSGGSADPSQVSRTWDLDPVLLLNLAVLWWLYGRGLQRMSARNPAGQSIAHWRPLAFLAGLACILLALVSPLDAISGQLASAHMVQHMLLMVIAAPLIALGTPWRVVPLGLPWHARRFAAVCRRRCGHRVPRLLRNPVATWLLQAAVLWAWHLPVLYELALRSPVVHDAQHLMFFGAGYWYWRLLLDFDRAHGLSLPAALISLFTTSLHAAALGVLLALSPVIWYSSFRDSATAWGISPLEDQQLAGLIMWMPACLVYALAAAAILGCRLESESPRPEQHRTLHLPPQFRTTLAQERSSG